MSDTTDPAPEPTEPRKRLRIAPLIAGGVAVVLIALFVILVTADKRRSESADSPLLGNIAPNATGELANGQPFELSKRKGSWVVLNFFTHTCVPCIREHPELVEFSEQQAALGNEGAELYTIVRDSSKQEVDEFFGDRGGDWPIVYDPRYEFTNQFGVAQVPETWVIDPNGFVRARIINEVTAEGLGSLIQQIRASS